MGLLALQGPMARDVLKDFFPHIESLKYYETLMPDSDGTIVARTGYSGELGFEIYISNDKIIDLWNKLLSSSDFIRPVGLGCRDSLRLEMGYCLYGHELDESINPLEAGLSWITKLDTGFIGSESLSNLKKEKTFDKVWKHVEIELLSVDYFFAHNAPFDRSVLHSSCNYYNIDLPPQEFKDTVILARKYWDF